MQTVLDSLFIGRIVQQRHLKKIYKCLCKIPLFKEVVKRTIKSGIEVGLRFLMEVIGQLIKEIKENKEILALTAKFSAKCVARNVILKRAVACGIHGMCSFNVVPALTDAAQTGLEQTGYETVGKGIGLVGNLSTGACAGLMVGGIPGMSIGILGGLATWILGESVSKGLDNAISAIP